MQVKDFLEAIDYRITGGSDFCWSCFGPNARYIDCESHEMDIGHQNEFSTSIVFDTVTQTVYQVEAHDYQNNRCYRWIDPDFVNAYKQEAKERDVDYRQAYDDVNFVDLDIAEDIIEKITAIVRGEDYDDRVSVPLVLDKEEIFDLMSIAHKRDITLNQLVESILRDAISEIETSSSLFGYEIQSPPFPSESFTQEEAREAVKKVRSKKKKKTVS